MQDKKKYNVMTDYFGFLEHWRLSTKLSFLIEICMFY